MKKVVFVILLVSIVSVYAEECQNKLAASMYSSGRASNVGDILTVLVNEATSSSKSEKYNTKKSSSANSSAAKLSVESKLTNDVIQKFMRQVPSYSLGGDSSFDGSGKVSSNEGLNATFSVRVVDVLPNSVLVIRGERVVMKGKEKIVMTLSGLVRKRDVSSGNFIKSVLISDARIMYKTSGEVSRASKPGWLWKLFQYINPF